MAREIWLKAKVHGLETMNDGTLRPLVRCGHAETGTHIIWAPFDSVQRLPEIECWAKGIINSSNNALVHTANNGYAPLGKADGQTRVLFGMQLREVRNDFSRDQAIEYLSSRENAERMCRLLQKFCGHDDDLACILEQNEIRPDFLNLKQLTFLANMVEALLKKSAKEPIILDKSVKDAIRKI